MTQVDHSLRPAQLLSDAGTPTSDDNATTHSADRLFSSLDENTVAYVLATRPHFDGLKQATGQIAGLLVLAAAGTKSITQEHAMLEAARAAHAEAADGLKAVRVPPLAVHHHHHLVQAAMAIGAALEMAASQMHDYACGRRDVDAALQPVKLGYRHLHWAASALPGFEVVSFEQACCAGHAAESAKA